MATIEQQKRILEKALNKMHPDAGLAEHMREKYRQLEDLEKEKSNK